jgi:hypothetical protein
MECVKLMCFLSIVIRNIGVIIFCCVQMSDLNDTVMQLSIDIDIHTVQRQESHIQCDLYVLLTVHLDICV